MCLKIQEKKRHAFMPAQQYLHTTIILHQQKDKKQKGKKTFFAHILLQLIFNKNKKFYECNRNCHNIHK